VNNNAKTAVILLLKGLFYRTENEKAFFELLNNSHGEIVAYLETIGLELMIDEEDGYAYLKNKIYDEEEEALPKLLGSRELSYKVSLLIMLLRKRRVDFDMQNDNERAIVSKEDIISELLFFLDIKFNEVKVKKEIESTIKKVEELGFLKSLKTSDEAYEIKSAIKSFVDAKFLDDFDKKLTEYKEANLWN
jgi:hypothetical protein